MSNEALLHATGRSRYLDDLPLPAGTLHAAVFVSPLAHGRLRLLKMEAAYAMPGVVLVASAADIPGVNEIGVVVDDEPLLAADIIRYRGEPLVLVVAETAQQARAAAAVIEAEIDPLPVVLSPRIAQAAGDLFAPARTMHRGDPAAVWEQCAHVVEGSVACGGQEQLYLETQGALAIPRDDGGMTLHSATQSTAGVQAVVARVLGLPMHQVEVDVLRLGGGFGGKESQASRWAALAALGAHLSGRPVKLVLNRREDIAWTGKRHAYEADFRLGLDNEGKILAYQAELYQNAGAYTDLSLAILERSLFHANGSYHIPNLRVTGWSCRTHIAPATAMRGFGGPQAVFVLESAIERAARQLGMAPEQLRERNLLAEGDHFHFGQTALRARAQSCWQQALQRYHFSAWQEEVAAFNRSERFRRRALAAMPICFGISFTHMPLNQGSALAHVYQDGSVGFSTGAVEMGQGVERKLCRVAADTLGLPLQRVRMESTNTTRVANASPSAASVTADLNGKALHKACMVLRERLLGLAAAELALPVVALTIVDGVVTHQGAATGLSWEALVARAYEARISLSAQAHHATPEIHFDAAREQGHPFAYHVYGTAITQVTLDTLRGTYQVDCVKVVHDVGRSLDPLVDRGQIEGGLVQGIGWLTSEALRYSPEGRLLTDSLATYPAGAGSGAGGVVAGQGGGRAPFPLWYRHLPRAVARAACCQAG